MTQEYSIVVAVDPTPAAQGAREFKRSMDDIAKSSETVSKSTKELTSSFTGLGKTVQLVKSLLLGFAAGFTLSAAISQITEFETSMAKLRGLMGPQALAGDMALLEARARELGATTVFSAGEAAQAMIELTKAGFNAQRAATAAKDALNLAAAEQMGLAEAASITAVTLNQFGLKADQAGRVTDVLSKISNAASTDVRGLAEGLKYAGNIAKGIGLTIEETAAAMGVLSDAGMDTSMSGTALRTSLSALLTPTKRSAEAMGQLGLTFDTVKKTLGQEGGFLKLVDMLAVQFRGISDPAQKSALAFEIFGDKGAGAMLALTSLNDRLRDYTKQANEAAGTTQAMADAMSDTLRGDLAEIESAFEELVLQIGDAGARGALRALAQDVGAFVRGLGGLNEEIDKSTSAMQSWNKVGQFLRNNVEFLTDAIIVLASVFVGRWVAALATSALAVTRQTVLNAALATSWQGVAAGAGRAAVTTTTFTVAATGLRSVLAVLGGPVGLILLAATAFLTFGQNAAYAGNETAGLKSEVDKLGEGFLKMGAKAQQAAFLQVQATSLSAKARALELKKMLADQDAAQAKLDENARRAKDGWGTAVFAGENWRIKQGMMPEADVARAKAELLELTGVTTSLNMKLLEMQGAVKGQHTGWGTLGDKLEEARGKLEAVDPPITAITTGTDGAAKSAKAFADSVSDLISDLAPLTDAYNKNQEKLATLRKLQSMTDSELKKFGLTMKDVELMSSKLAQSYQDQVNKLDPMYETVTKVKEKYEELLKAQNPLAVANRDYAKQMAEVNKLIELGDERLSKFGLTVAQLKEVQVALGKELNTTTAEIGKQAAEAKKNADQADPWMTAWKSAIERMDGMFSNMWKSMFDGFDSFKDSILDGFKSMIAEMIHAATTRKLTTWFADLMGQGGGGVFSTGGAGGNNLTSMISNVFGKFLGNTGGSSAANSFWGALGNTVKGWFGLGGAAASSLTGTAATQGVGAYLNAGSWMGLGGSGYAGYGVLQTGAVSSSTVGAASGATSALGSVASAVPIIGAIIAGMMANDKFFAQGWRMDGQAGDITKSLFSSTLKGNIFGPILGEMTMGIGLADRVLQGIGLSDRTASLISGSALWTRAFGRGAPKVMDSGLQANLQLGGFTGSSFTTTREKGGWFRSDKWRTYWGNTSSELNDYMSSVSEDVRDLIKEIAKDADSETKKALESIRIETGKVSLSQNAEERAKQLEDLANKLREQMAEAALKALDFGELLEADDRTMSAADLLKVIKDFMDSIKKGVVDEAQKVFDDAQLSATERYRKDFEDFKKLEYDGSQTSLLKLIEATNNLKVAQAELAIGLMNTAKAAKEMFANTKQNIRESTMTDEELYATRQQQIQQLMGQLRTETDPTKLMELANQINGLTTSAWGMLDEDQRKELQGGFLSFLDEVDALLQDRVGVGLDQLETDTQEINKRAAEQLQASAQTMTTAVGNFSSAVERFGTYLERMNRTGRGSELTML